MVCCRCNRSGSCKNCQCVKLGRMCDGCLPGRLGNCHNSTCAAPAPAPARANMSATPANMSAAPAMGTNRLGNVPSVSTACLLSVSQQPCAGAFTMGQTASASSRSVNVPAICPRCVSILTSSHCSPISGLHPSHASFYSPPCPQRS